MAFEKEDYTFILSVIATVISSILALLKIQENRKKAKRKYDIEARVLKPFKYLEVTIINKGYRPITITGFELYYGNEFIKKDVLIKDFTDTKKLLESDKQTFKIDRKEIIKQKELKSITQEYACELWVRLIFSTKEKTITRVEVDSRIIEKEVDSKAIKYVCADLFLGYNQMESKYKKYIRGGSHLSSGKH